MTAIYHNYILERLRKIDGCLLPNARRNLIQYGKTPEIDKYAQQVTELWEERKSILSSIRQGAMDSTCCLENVVGTFQGSRR